MGSRLSTKLYYRMV